MSDQERYFFDLYGYLVVEAVLGPEEIRHLNQVIEAQDLPQPGDEVGSQRFWGEFLAWDPACLALIDQPKVLAIMEELCGPHLRLDHAYGIVMSPQTGGLGLHGGGTPFDPSQYYEFRGGRIYNGLCVASYALVDVEPGHGGFCCVPGSHKANLPRPDLSSLPDHLDMVRHVPHRAGSVVIFTEALTHGTLPWSAPYPRRHLLFKYSPGNSGWDRAGWYPEEVREAMTERQRRLLEPPYVAYRKGIED